MPWCETCDRFYNPNSLRPDGTCAVCGRQVGGAGAVDAPATGGAPWHFKLLIAVTAAYLGWRLLQGLVWVAQHL